MMSSSAIQRRIGVVIDLINPHGTQWYVISFGIGFGLNIIFTLVAASSLGAGGFGGFTLFTTVIQFAVTIVNAGFYTSTLTKANSHSSRPRVDALTRTRLTTSLALCSALGIVLAIPICLVRPTITNYIASGMIYVLLIALQPLWIYQLSGEHRIFNVLQICQRACFAVPAVIAMRLNLDLPWVCIIFAISPLPSAIYIITKNSQLYNAIRPERIMKYRTLKTIVATLRSESRFLLVDLLATMATCLPTLIIAKTSNMHELGGYSLTDRLRSYVITIFSPLNSSQYHRLCRYYLQGMYVRASILLSRYQVVTFLFSVIVACFANTILQSKLSGFGSGQYDNTQQAFEILAIFIPFLVVSSGVNLLYFSTQRLALAQQISSILKVVLFALVYLPSHSYIGTITAATTGTVASELMATIIVILSSRRYSKLSLRLW